MKNKILKKVIAVILCISFAFCVTTVNAFGEDVSSADTTDTTQLQDETVDEELAKQEAQKTLEEQKADLQAKLADSEERLKSFEDSAKGTENYINTLDEKIGYLNEELTLLDAQVEEAQKKVDELEKQIVPLEKELEQLKAEYDAAKEEFNKLNDEFTTTYNAYCLRLRAMYVSGSNSIIVALLTSKDIAQFFNRYEMIKAIAKSDTQLLKEVNEQMETIITQQNGLNERKTDLTQKQESLNEKQSESTARRLEIEANQEEIARKKIIIAQDRAESDRLLAEYTAKTQMYTEFRNEDEALIESVNAEIDALISGLKSADEVTTASPSDYDKSNATTVNSDSSLYSNSNAVLNLTYPAPGHYAVSAPFGHYSNGKPHTGIDFPYPKGSKVVAAQKGIVIKVKRLDYSYGYYIMIYHGTDAQGRTVVTLYAHNSSILVSAGQTVKKGQQIAKGGSTGNSTGPHCHFELILDGTKVNPKNYLSK